MMGMLDRQDMCKVKEPNGAGRGLLHACQQQPLHPGRKHQTTRLDAAIKATSQLLQLKEQIAVISAVATCLHNLQGSIGPQD